MGIGKKAGDAERMEMSRNVRQQWKNLPSGGRANACGETAGGDLLVTAVGAGGS